jgi:hypothetical protein
MSNPIPKRKLKAIAKANKEIRHKKRLKKWRLKNKGAKKK